MYHVSVEQSQPWQIYSFLMQRKTNEGNLAIADTTLITFISGTRTKGETGNKLGSDSDRCMTKRQSGKNMKQLVPKQDQQTNKTDVNNKTIKCDNI